MLVVFSLQDNLQLAILTLIVFSIFVQASEGTTYALVPYIKPEAMGGVSGIIGAGGNIGAICFGLFLGFSGFGTMVGFRVLGIFVIFVSVLSPIITIALYKDSWRGSPPVPSKI